MTFRVTADIKYIDGTLAGLEIPAGFSATYPNRSIANRCSAWLERTMRAKDFVRATGTGAKFNITGRICVERVRPLIFGV